MIVGFLSYAFFSYQPKVPERPVPSVEECKMGWDALLGIITTMIPILDAKRAREQEHVERVLNALGTAYFATETYFANLESGSPSSRADQLALAEKWDHVANVIRRYDQNLASRFSIKSRFWSEGGTWDRRQIQQANIGLEKIRMDARSMLLLKQYAKPARP
ncbi:hypothetical protein [Pseudomonas amygdali]|uniref:hypothetical protein n=1 Tax=Pseudomonas amygdali TaxID=47877 RepID=UPI0011C44458|nr:hypothetical protein [Pseudomonas amygdali]